MGYTTMKYFMILGATLLAGCMTTTAYKFSTEDLTSANRIKISQESFEGSVIVDRTDGNRLLVKYITFHADSLYYACAQFAAAQEPVAGLKTRRSCWRAMPTDSGGAMALSEIAGFMVTRQSGGYLAGGGFPWPI